MAKTKIEWCDYTINPVKGLCPMACSFCYARRMYKRFKWNPEIRYEDLFYSPGIKGRVGDKYFVGSTIELFGDWIRPEWLEDIFRWVNAYPQRTFIFLTKQPQHLVRWSPFPENCWVGVSATGPEQIRLAFKHLDYDVKAPVKFVSFEPLLGMIFSSFNVIERFIKASGVNWAIIGRQTPPSKKTEPNLEWIQEIESACDKAGIPIFEKNNLKSLLNRPLKQEFPKVLKGE